MNWPIKYEIFKSSSAARFSVVKPKHEEDAKKTKPGYVYLELASATGQNPNDPKLKSYDWNNKIGVKLGHTDISAIGYALKYGKSTDNLFHEFNGAIKTIKFTRTEEGKSPYFLSVVFKTADGVETKVSIPISKTEAYAISVMMDRSLCSIFDW